MKKFAWIIACAALAASLSACGSKSDDTAATATVSPADAANAKQVVITASNWKFDQPEYKVKKGEPVTVTLKLEQGVHGLEIEKLGVKLDNKNSTKTFTPDKPGKYTITCTIPCGSDHLKMKSTFVVEE